MAFPVRLMEKAAGKLLQTARNLPTNWQKESAEFKSNAATQSTLLRQTTHPIHSFMPIRRMSVLHKSSNEFCRCKTRADCKLSKRLNTP